MISLPAVEAADARGLRASHEGDTSMRALAKIQVLASTPDTTLRGDLFLAYESIKDEEVAIELHAHGTTLEGDLPVVLECMRRVHLRLRAERGSHMRTIVCVVRHVPSCEQVIVSQTIPA